MWRKLWNRLKNNIRKSIKKDLSSIGIDLNKNKLPIFKPTTREEKIARIKEIRKEREAGYLEEQQLLKEVNRLQDEPSSSNMRNNIINKFKENINYQLWVSNMENFENYLQSDNAGRTFYESFKSIDNIWNFLLEKSNYFQGLQNLDEEINKWKQFLIDSDYDSFINDQALKLENNFYNYEKVKLFYEDIIKNRYENAIIRLINLGIIDETEYNYETFY